jgi:hypothetical protein
MAKYLMDQDLLKQKQTTARECAERNYDWHEIVKQWEFIFDKKKILDRDTTWNKPAKLIEIDMSEPDENMPDDQFVDWCYIHILAYEPHAVDQEGKQNWLRTLEYHKQNGKTPAEARRLVLDFFRGEANNLNVIERLRSGEINDKPEAANPDAVTAMIIT